LASALAVCCASSACTVPAKTGAQCARRDFPTIGKSRPNFSNDWKMGLIFFQRLENDRFFLPTIGKRGGVFMKRISLWFGLNVVVLSASAQLFSGYQPYTDGHMDIGMRVVEGELVGFWKNDSATVAGGMTFGNYPANGLRALGVFDADTPPLLRPAGSQWDFLGVAAGAPIYILPSGGMPATVPYLGLSTEDVSLSPLGVDEVRLTLLDMAGPAGGVFSLFTSSANRPMNTTNGFPAGALVMELGDHLHFNWGFSHPGTYDLTFQFEAMSGASVVLSGTDVFRFQITDGGGFAGYEQWRETVFSPAEIADAAVSGPAAMPLADGVTNLQRFLFGAGARAEWVWVEFGDQVYPGIEFLMRTDTGMEVAVEFATQLDAPDWRAEDLVLAESERIFHDPGMERRVYRLVATGSATGFFRFGVLP
jgi:surface-anchored protein